MLKWGALTRITRRRRDSTALAGVHVLETCGDTESRYTPWRCVGGRDEMRVESRNTILSYLVCYSDS